MHARRTALENNLFLLPVLIGGIIFLLFSLAVYEMLWAPNTFEGGPRIVPISKGEGLSKVAETLDARGVIASRFLFKLAGRSFGYAAGIRYGKYSFPSGISNLDILRHITSGTSTANPAVTVHEGLRSAQIAKLLQREVGVDSAKFMSLISDTSLVGVPGHGASSLEGFLFPETYDIYWQADEKEILVRMLTEFRKFFADSLQRRTRRMGMTIAQVLTMASIVEGEAVRDDERPVIAGLYFNRLRLGIRLEADPTIQFIIPDSPRRLSHDDLQIESPYNTYRNYGLPPGPINNPGRKSILAVLYPAHHAYVYFVADGNGGHRFSRTYEEHLKNVRQFRRMRQLGMGRR